MPDQSPAPPQVRRKTRFSSYYADGRIGKATAMKWLREGRLRTYRIDGLLFVDETLDEAIERLAAEQAAERSANRAA